MRQFVSAEPERLEENTLRDARVCERGGHCRQLTFPG
jgi:hypothetical protein